LPEGEGKRGNGLQTEEENYSQLNMLEMQWKEMVVTMGKKYIFAK
jgi:hypothetical protein